MYENNLVSVWDQFKNKLMAHLLKVLDELNLARYEANP